MGEFASKGLAGTALGFGIGGTALGVLGGGLGNLLGNLGGQPAAQAAAAQDATAASAMLAAAALAANGRNGTCNEDHTVNRYEAQKDARIAELETEVKLRDANTRQETMVLCMNVKRGTIENALAVLIVREQFGSWLLDRRK